MQNEIHPESELGLFQDLCQQTISDLNDLFEAEENGEVDPDDADISVFGLLVEHNRNAMDIFGLEVEEEPQEMETEEDEVAIFSQGVQAALVSLIDQEYDNIEDAIADLMAATESDREVIEGILDGELVPDADLGSAIASVFESLQGETAYQEWMGIVASAFRDAGGEAQTVASMSAPIDNMVAEFEQMKARTQLGEELRILARQADEMVANGILTPWERKELLGNCSDSQDAIALFSQACETTQTPLAVQLDRTKFYLHVAQRRGQVALFGEYAQEDYGTPALTPAQESLVTEIFKEMI